MNYTENYHLPQWEETDRIMRTDFNQMCADIESGIAEAKKKADEAYSTDRPPFAVGSYMGTGDTPMVIETGFRPRFVIVTGQVMAQYDSNMRKVMLAGEGIMTDMISFRDSGFTISRVKADTSSLCPRVNETGERYFYIAFR